jgi:hypothetical protein
MGMGTLTIFEKTKEFPFYRIISKNQEYQNAKQKIRNEFTPKPYIEEFPEVDSKKKDKKKLLKNDN